MSTTKLQILGGFPQADFNQTDETKSDYIKNKPDISILQPKTDNSLETESKEVVGAINEIHTELSNKLPIVIVENVAAPTLQTIRDQILEAIGATSWCILRTNGAFTKEVLIQMSHSGGDMYTVATLNLTDGKLVRGTVDVTTTDLITFLNRDSTGVYQPKTDNSLETTEKTVAGAINEVNRKIPTCTAADSGKFLCVNSEGVPTWETVATADISYDETTNTLNITTS